jgi:hypothetical protein
MALRLTRYQCIYKRRHKFRCGPRTQRVRDDPKITTWLKKDVFGGAALNSRPLHAINAQEFCLLVWALKDFSHVCATHNFFLAPRLLVNGRQTHAIVSRQPARSAGRDGCIPTCRWRRRHMGRRAANQTAAEWERGGAHFNGLIYRGCKCIPL